ncbi:MAG: hypothetical protein H6737_12530 [Alphaproteobacteria bacterium]|nr:hypothetical protein [Alphaproteobacteria bacterium]
MDPRLYTVVWIVACAGALAALLVREDLEIRSADYWRFLLQPWKLATFATAWMALLLLAPFAGDPTWDRVDATFMGVLTFATAPWAVGTLAKGLFGQRGAVPVAVAACLWLFSTSWSYDAYLWWRDGAYPDSSLSNLVASGCLYLYAGVLWNLSWRSTSELPIAFQDSEWPAPSDGDRFLRVAPFAAGVIAPVALVLLTFVL